MNLKFAFIVLFYLVNCCFCSSINSNSLNERLVRLKRGFSDRFSQGLRPIIPAGKKVNQVAKKFWDRLECMTGGQNENCVRKEDGSYEAANPGSNPNTGDSNISGFSTEPSSSSQSYPSSTPDPSSYLNDYNSGSSSANNDNSPITGSNTDPNNANAYRDNRPNSPNVQPGARESEVNKDPKLTGSSIDNKNSSSNPLNKENGNNDKHNSNVFGGKDNELNNVEEKSRANGLPNIGEKEKTINGSRLGEGSTPNRDFKNDFFNSDNSLGRLNGSMNNGGASLSSVLPPKSSDIATSTSSSLLDKNSKPDDSSYNPNGSMTDKNAASSISMDGCTCTCPSSDSNSSSTLFEIVDAEKEEDRKPGNSNIRFRLIKKNSPIVYVKRPKVST